MNEKSVLEKLSKECGFSLFGVASASAPPAALKNLGVWISQGLNGGKEYLKRQEAKRLDPSLVLPGVKSILCFGLLYNTDKPYSVECPGQPWISRYAWGVDYHKVIGAMLEKMGKGIEAAFPGVRMAAFCDSGPVSEKPWAAAAGLGWQGKNTLLINPDLGSWLFLGVILTDLAVEPDQALPDRCGSCRACLDACPTGALKEPYVMDAAKCISSLNLGKGEMTREQQASIGNHLAGCDICQDVCPWNRKKRTTDNPAFQCLNVNWKPDLDRLAAMADEEFKRVYEHSYVGNLRPSLWQRNAGIVKGNLDANRL